MTTLTIHPSVGENCCYSLAVEKHSAKSAKLFADIANLVKFNNPTGQLNEDTLVSDLQRFFEEPDVDRECDLRIWKEPNGNLIGFGQLFISEQNDEIEGCLYFDIHPTWRGTTLQTEILQWSEQRMGEVQKERGVPVQLHTRCCEDRFEHLVRLEKQGFIHDRSFLTVARSFNQPLPSFSLPTGFTIRPLSTHKHNFQVPRHELNAWVELFNESFIDHWGNYHFTAQTASYFLNNPSYKPELNLVAVAPDGTFAAFCVGSINWAENACSGCNEGWIEFLGTGRGFRKLGLGRSLLLAVMKQLQTAGIEQVKLGVDAQSLTGAMRLYQSVGFQPIKTWRSYVKEIQP